MPQPELITIGLLLTSTGILISMMLRQYFMSLEVLGRWKRLDSGLGHLLGRVQTGMRQNSVSILVHPITDAAPASTPSISPTRLKRRNTVVEGQVIDLDSEEDSSASATSPTDANESERRLGIMRKVMRKWWRLAGLHGHPSIAHENLGEFDVEWPRGIAPRLEGRIKIAGV